MTSAYLWIRPLNDFGLHMVSANILLILFIASPYIWLWPFYGFGICLSLDYQLIAIYTFAFEPSKHLFISSYTVGIRNHRMICDNPSPNLSFILAIHAFRLSMPLRLPKRSSYLCLWATKAFKLPMLLSYSCLCLWATYAFGYTYNFEHPTHMSSSWICFKLLYL